MVQQHARYNRLMLVDVIAAYPAMDQGRAPGVARQRMEGMGRSAAEDVSMPKVPLGPRP